MFNMGSKVRMEKLLKQACPPNLKTLHGQKGSPGSDMSHTPNNHGAKEVGM